MTSSLVGSEMCIRDRLLGAKGWRSRGLVQDEGWGGDAEPVVHVVRHCICLLYTSDAADDM
eukprot:505913-Prorocentrum_lima.AAC.1